MYTLGSYTVEALNGEEFHELKREIFSRHIYYLDLEFDHPPSIIDAGAHIGLATLYFKQLWPEAQILAIEPNPDTAELLRQNIARNQLQDVAILEAALSDRHGNTTLHVDDSWDRWYSSGSLHEHAWNGAADTMPVNVATVTLPDLLSGGETIDLLKLDIEGWEGRVLRRGSKHLSQVRHLIMEYHPRKDNDWKAIEKILAQQRFQWSWSVHGQVVPQPPPKQLTLLEAHQPER